MSINFHGIKNVIGCHDKQNPIAKSNNAYSYNGSGDSLIAFEVDNNETRDLDEAQKIFVKYPSSLPNTVHLLIKDSDKYILNGQSIEFNEENFKIFGTLMNFVKQIAKKNPSDFIIEDNFNKRMQEQKETAEQQLQEAYNDKGIKLTKEWDPYWAKESARLINKTLKQGVTKYFEA